MYSCTSAKLLKPSMKLGLPLTEDAQMSGTNGNNGENNEDPQIVVLDHAEQNKIALTGAKKEQRVLQDQTALALIFFIQIQQKSLS